MKRCFSIVPVFLLMLLNACGSMTPTVPSNIGTAVGQTQTATMWTPTVTPTPDPNEAKIVEWLNAELLNADPLEQTLDARYQVVDVSFPVSPVSLSTVFRVDVRCECATNANCCVPERMFVVIVEAMKKRAEKIIEQVPAGVSEMRVVCFEHTTHVGVISGWWLDVKGYLLDQINGYQLGARVFRSNIP